MVEKKQYREVANLIEAVGQLSKHFGSYQRVPKIMQLTSAVSDIKRRVGSMCYDEFKLCLETPQPHSLPSHQLTDVCFVVDALGEDFKKDFIKWFCEAQLREYKSAFNMHSDVTCLSDISKRFALLRKLLILFESQYTKVFPNFWRIPELICQEFCFFTREKILEVLERGHQSKTLEVSALVSALQITVAFEKEMSERVAKATPFLVEADGNDGAGEEEEAPPDGETPAEAAKRNLRNRIVREERGRASTAPKVVVKAEAPSLKGIISVCFDPYLSELYVSKEERALEKHMSESMASEDWLLDETERQKVLNSSISLVLAIRNSMKKVSAMTRNQAYYDMSQLYRRLFKAYARFLVESMPSLKEQLPPDSSSLESRLALIVNTADYLTSQADQLVEAIRASIATSFVERVDMSQLQEEFNNVIARAIKQLVRVLELKIDQGLHQMTSIAWHEWDSVGDSNEYVAVLTAALTSSLTHIASYLSPSHYRFLCRSFLSMFVPKLVSTIFRCQNISGVGAEQMLLDVAAIKTVVKDIPKLAPAYQASAHDKVFEKSVHKEIMRAEILLKVVTQPVQSLAASYKDFIDDGSEPNFIHIMDLKGIRKEDQVPLINEYRRLMSDKIAVVSPKMPQKGASPTIPKSY